MVHCPALICVPVKGAADPARFPRTGAGWKVVRGRMPWSEQRQLAVLRVASGRHCRSAALLGSIL